MELLKWQKQKKNVLDSGQSVAMATKSQPKITSLNHEDNVFMFSVIFLLIPCNVMIQESF